MSDLRLLVQGFPNFLEGFCPSSTVALGLSSAGGPRVLGPASLGPSPTRARHQGSPFPTVGPERNWCVPNPKNSLTGGYRRIQGQVFKHVKEHNVRPHEATAEEVKGSVWVFFFISTTNIHAPLLFPFLPSPPFSPAPSEETKYSRFRAGQKRSSMTGCR